MAKKEFEYTKQEINTSLGSGAVTCSHEWFSCEGKYPPRSGVLIEPLVNGEKLFAWIAHWIQNATKSVDILMWQFDPFMYLAPHASARLHLLLEEAGKRGVICRIMLWDKYTWQQKLQRYVTSAGEFYDSEKVAEWFKRIKNGELTNIYLYDRDFSSADRKRVAKKLAAEPDSNWYLRLVNKHGLSHHQKVVLVDYHKESLNNCVGFIMGSNFTQQYWDTDAHNYDHIWDPMRGAPSYQDISCAVQGPILYDINDTFVNAWGLAEGNNDLSEARKDIQPDDLLAITKGKPVKNIQLCRTQPQEVLATTQDYDRSILDVYKKAISNAHDLIYIENQYFRYPTIARLIRERARALWNKKEEYGLEAKPIYLFVITNHPLSDEAGSGGDTTYYTLKELGQQQLMTEAQRTSYHERGILHYLNPLNWFKPSTKDSDMSDADKDRIENIETKEDVSKLSELDPDDADNKPFELEEFEEIKIVIGTLKICPPKFSDTISAADLRVFTNEDNQKLRMLGAYPPVATHSKLMIVDDLWTTIGSANINMRSMFSDSETNVVVPDHDLAWSLREHLWKNHVGRSLSRVEASGSHTLIKCDGKENFNHWDATMNENWRRMAKLRKLSYFLCRYWDTATEFNYAFD